MDWLNFCEEHRIDSSHGGSSTKKNNLYVECPWCQNGKHRLGMNTEAPYFWGCWLDKTHRGKSPVRLIMKLIGVSYEEACDIAGIRPNHSELGELIGEFKQLQDSGLALGPAHNDQSDSRSQGIEPYKLHSSWFDLRPKGKLSRRFIAYLAKRGLPPECCTRYQLMASCALVDWNRWANRVISPVIVAGEVVAITARAIGRDPYRYLTDPHGVPNRVLYNAQHATGGEVLVLVEGPYDAKKLDWAAYISKLPVHTVASMGLVLSRDKEADMQRLMTRYRRTVILFDSTAMVQALALQRRLSREIGIEQLPANVSDPAEFSVRAASAYLKEFLQ